MAKKPTAATSARQAKIDAARKKSRNTGGGANRIVVGAVVAVVAIVAVVAGVVITESNRQKRVGTSTATPAGVGAMGEGFVANKDVQLVAGAPTLEVYEDFQCPACAEFEQAVGPTIKQLADDGKIRLVYHLKTFLDANLRTTHSLAMGNAAMCAADAGKFQAFHDTVYANMPAQEGQGWTSSQTEGFAEEAGITGDAKETWQTCVDERTYATYVESTEESSAKAGVNATPTIRLAGKTLDLNSVRDSAGLVAAVEAATT
jgi:protein-disulfide isomerase